MTTPASGRPELGRPDPDRPDPGRDASATIGGWPTRRWVVAGASTVGTVLLVGIPTALVPTGVFGRGVPAPMWAWPVLLTTATLSGLLTATYVAAAGPQVVQPKDPGRRGAMAGGFLTYLAVGCPTCNKVALLALGASGAIRWFAPLQPALAGIGVLLLMYALRKRLAGARACPLPVSRG
jgi:hypothetical protein